MGKRELLLDSAKKLLKEGASVQDIASEMSGLAGISFEEAQSIVEDAKKETELIPAQKEAKEGEEMPVQEAQPAPKPEPKKEQEEREKEIISSFIEKPFISLPEKPAAPKAAEEKKKGEEESGLEPETIEPSDEAELKLPEFELKAAAEKKIVFVPAKEKEIAVPEKSAKKLSSRHSRITLVALPSKGYTSSIVELAQTMAETYSLVCYVSLNDRCDSLFRSFADAGIDMKRFFLIDAITKTSQAIVEPRSNCVFVSSPNALIELSLAISDVLAKQRPDAILLDSLSTLLIYENPSTVTKFMHSLIGKVRTNSVDGVFTVLDSDQNAEAVKDLGMFIDDSLSLDEFSLISLEGPAFGKPSFAKKPRMEKISGLLKEVRFEEPVYEKASAQKVQAIEAQTTALKKIVQREMQRLALKMDKLKKEPQVKDDLKEHLSRLEQKIEKLEKQPAQVQKAPKVTVDLSKLAKKINSIKQQPSIKKELKQHLNMLDLRFREMEKHIAKRRKISVEEKNHRNLLAKKQRFAQKKKAEHEELMHRLEKKLLALNRSYALGVVSKDAYSKDKKKIEEMLRKG
ncbi:MAG: hypothetical protein V1494_01655 [Candidatus Diapherotrites archaeon]